MRCLLRNQQCQACRCNCGLLATHEKGRVIKVEKDPENPMIYSTLIEKGFNTPSRKIELYFSLL